MQSARRSEQRVQSVKFLLGTTSIPVRAVTCSFKSNIVRRVDRTRLVVGYAGVRFQVGRVKL
ncbi:hypothetical protein PISMIDRAFT_563534 [Pisolithus microcarpus 441]|uniref:Uncharacterized protein n=1 Tax=Pisolithus microcarpus 441 TaxID=765257 RepID=A0A0C9Z4W4_9AGAM|nr:hypothetical protein PISMIDRAFT_563534 [Pisolithus microcarpus 441]